MNNTGVILENDIYEFLVDADLYNVVVDGTLYNHYIIYTQNNVNYKVFIHESIINSRSNIEFFANKKDDNSEISNRLIILAYKQDLPMLILLDNNEKNSDAYDSYEIPNNYYTELLGDDDDDNDFDYFSYDTIKLSYQDSTHYKDDIGNIYNIFSNDKPLINKIIRHYKLIRQTSAAQKFEILDKLNNYHQPIYKIYHLLNLKQNPNFYLDNIYEDEGFSNYNEYNDDYIYFHKYTSIEELQDKINKDRKLAKYNYLNKVNKDYSTDEEFKNEMKTLLENYSHNTGYLYIRLAPTINDSPNQIKRALILRRIYSNYDNNENLLNEAVNDGMINGHVPIWNDNLFYSETKQNYIEKYIEGNKQQIND